MFCSRCGRAVRSDANECPACGWYLRGDSQENYYRENSQENYYGGNPYVHYPRYKEKNGIAIAGFICSFISPLLGWIFGGIGLSRADQRNGKGEGLSIAALVISTIMFVINIIVLGIW